MSSESKYNKLKLIQIAAQCSNAAAILRSSSLSCLQFPVDDCQILTNPPPSITCDAGDCEEPFHRHKSGAQVSLWPRV